MKIHQILINDTNKLPNEFPEFHNICLEQLKKLYPNEEYHLYSGKELEQIIKNNFHNDVFTAYKKLKPYACKADLARLCLLYLYGGLYIDLNLYFVNTIPDLENLEFFAFRDKPKASQQYWAVHNGIIYSLKKSKILENAINLIVENCKNEYYGINTIDVSATPILGRAITLSLPNFEISTQAQLDFFTIKSLDKKTQNKIKNIGYSDKILDGFIMDANDKLIAIKKPSGPGDIKSLGFEGTNNYTEMWKNKEVYNTSIKFIKKSTLIYE
jgi:mannosyltransferase OCH1-like enzyme